MTFADIRQRIEALLKLGAWTNVEPPPDMAFLANEGSRLFFWEAQCIYLDDTDTTVINQSEYTLTTPPDWVLVQDVLYGTSTALIQSSEAAMRKINPTWLQESSGTPRYWWTSAQNKIRLHPKPSTAGTTLYFHGVGLDAVMDSDGDIPNCAPVFHEGICLLGAWHHAKTFARGDEIAIADRLFAEGMQYAQRCRDAQAGQETAVFQRRVNREYPDYLSLGTW